MYFLYIGRSRLKERCCFFALIFSQAFWLTVTNDKPGGHIRHFWLAVTHMSTFQSSTGNLSPPRIDIASTISKMSSSSQSVPISWRLLTVTPVEVSL